MKHIIAIACTALGALSASSLAPTPAHANGQGGGSTPAAPCVANYADIDLASRSMSWGVYCPEGGQIFVDAQVFYGSELVTLPDAGARTVAPGETWTVWSQDPSRWGRADHGVLHIVQENGNGPASVLAHKVK